MVLAMRRITIARKRHTAEEIVSKLRQVDTLTSFMKDFSKRHDQVVTN
jgi:hypothetical protein